MKKLRRNLDSYVVGGVCSGISDFINIDVVIIRILFLCGLYFGSWVLYVILWICMPYKITENENSYTYEEDDSDDDVEDEYDDDENSQIIKPDSDSQYQIHDVSVFLAGSIELGTAELWQARILDMYEKKPITFYNPRCDDWDPNTIMRKSDPRFNRQVNWELDNIRNVDIVFMYFDPNTKSGVTIGELGVLYALSIEDILYSEDKKVVVVCPDGFWRKA